MMRRWFDAAVEGIGWFEVFFAALFAFAAYWISRMSHIPIPNRVALYGSLVAVSVGLMAVSAIVVNLSSAIIPGTERLQRSIGQLSVANFVGLTAYLLSAGIAVFLLAVDEQIGRPGRYIAIGAWLGLVSAASVRSLALGARILITNLRARTNN